MASPNPSLEPLSSPSPTPSPPPLPQVPHNHSSAHPDLATSFRPIDTDSELSELTDDDQDASTSAEKRAASTAAASSSKGQGRAVIDDDDDPPTSHSGGIGGSPLRTAMRGKQRLASSSRRGAGRRKRSSIVPAPMWGWVPEKTATNSAAVEEEEEEMSGPPRAMEEEEEEDDDDDEGEEEVADEYDGYGHGDDSGEPEDDTHIRRHRRQTSYQSKRRRPRQSAPNKRVNTKHENGDDRPLANGEDDEGSASGGSEYVSTKRKKLVRARRRVSNSRRRNDSGHEDESSGSDAPAPRKKNGIKSQHEDPDGEGASQGEDHTDSEAHPIPHVSNPTSPPPLPKLNSKPIVPSTTANSSAALDALAALVNAVDTIAPPPSIVAAVVSSVEVAKSVTASEAGTRDPSPSRLATPGAKLPAEESADESKIAKSKLKAAKSAPRAGKGKSRGKPSTPDDEDPPPTVASDDENATIPALEGDTSVTSAVDVVEEMDLDEEANDHSIEDPDVDMDPSEPDHEEDEDEGEEEIHEEDDEPEEPHQAEEEAIEVEPEGEEEEEEEVNEGDDDGADPEGDEEQEHEQDNEQDAAEVPNDNEEGEDEADNDEEHASQNGDADVDVEDHESDLQPAHRAEALDVLATIELKFALLRERVYVEKMEALAWEELLVQNVVHPELQHLQKELSKRRDKRLELASRKRSYEEANAVARRNADESNIWSWWKFTRDDLQTEMIAETSRKRRKLERERRAIERPQPIRRIPHLSEIPNPPLPPPSLRKIIKSYPFGSRKHNKPDTHRHRHHHHHHRHSQYPKNLVYPEISTLSASDIQSDLDFLFQHRRNSGYDQQPLIQPPHYPSQLQRNGSMMSGVSMGRSSMMPNGGPSLQPTMGPPQPSFMHPQHLGMSYEPYNDMSPSFGPSGAPGRVRDQYAPPGPGSSRDGMNAYPNYPMSGGGGRLPPSMHGQPMSMGPGPHHGYTSEHEMSTMVPGGMSNGGNVHQPLPNHLYFGQAGSSAGHGPPPLPPHMSGHHLGGMNGLNARHSVSPVHGAPNGNGNPKANGSWMGMGNFHGGNGGKGEWDSRMMHEDEERDRALRDQRERKRDEREKEQRDRDMDRARRDREYNDQERDRQREHQHMQQMSHRQASVHGSTPSHPSLSHIHSTSGGPPQAPGANAHHLHNHHHHRMHHHHVVHHHHPQPGPQHASSMPLTGAAPPITHSPRSTRDYEGSRLPPQGPVHTGPGQPHPTELIMLSSENKRQPSGHWPGKIVDDPPHHPSIADYRDRDRDAMNRERADRDSRKIPSGRHSTGPPLEDRGDRPMAMPFVMASSHTMQQAAAGMSSTSHINGSGLSSSTPSPRGAPAWNGAGAMDDSYRMSGSAPPPSGYLGSPRDAHVRSPVQGHRYATNSGAHAPQPLGRMANAPSSAIHHRIATTPPPPTNRARPPQSPSYPPTSTAYRSPVNSPKTRALSPVPASSTNKHILSGPPPGPGYSSSPHLSGPGRTSTPTGHHPPPPLSSGPPSSMQDVVMKNGALPPYNGSSRTGSPLMSSLQGSGRPTVNGASGIGGDRDRNERDRERLSPRLGASSVPLAPPPSKLSAAQMVDGR